MKLKINESKTFEFEMNTNGCSWKELKGYFRLTLENIEYGFPVSIEEGIVKVNIPVFKDILHENIRSYLYEHKETVIKARLDLIANNEVYIQPWSGNIDIEIPVSVKLTESKEKIKDTKIKVVDPDIKEYIEEEKKQEKKSKFLDAIIKLDESIEEKVEEKVEEKKAKKKSKFLSMLKEDKK